MLIDNITRAELKVMLKVHRDAVVELERIEKDTANGCSSCLQFAKSTSFCSKHKAPVPAEFQAQGCDEWLYDSIPF